MLLLWSSVAKYRGRDVHMLYWIIWGWLQVNTELKGPPLTCCQVLNVGTSSSIKGDSWNTKMGMLSNWFWLKLCVVLETVTRGKFHCLCKVGQYFFVLTLNKEMFEAYLSKCWRRWITTYRMRNCFFDPFWCIDLALTYVFFKVTV